MFDPIGRLRPSQFASPEACISTVPSLGAALLTDSAQPILLQNRRRAHKRIEFGHKGLVFGQPSDPTYFENVQKDESSERLFCCVVCLEPCTHVCYEGEEP